MPGTDVAADFCAKFLIETRGASIPPKLDGRDSYECHRLSSPDAGTQGASPGEMK